MEVVKIDVGTGLNKKPFWIHKTLLSEKAPVFGRMFNGGFIEAETNYASLPEDDPMAFEAFVEWLYRGTIKTIRLDLPKNEDAQGFEIFAIYVLASKYLLTELADRSLSGYVKYINAKQFIPGPGVLASMYTKSPPYSKARQLAAELAAYTLLKFPSTNNNDSWSSDRFCDVFNTDVDFMFDVLSAMRQQPGQEQTDPRISYASICAYHQHAGVKICPYPSQVEDPQKYQL
jgi:hypothetical protein